MTCFNFLPSSLKFSISPNRPPLLDLGFADGGGFSDLLTTTPGEVGGGAGPEGRGGGGGGGDGPTGASIGSCRSESSNMVVVYVYSCGGSDYQVTECLDNKNI